MVNDTVNGIKIGTPAGRGENIKVTYFGFGKRVNEKETIKVGRFGSNPLIENLRKNGELSAETPAYVAIKAYPREREERKEDREIAH